jgi:thymidylate synthase ThyX
MNSNRQIIIRDDLPPEANAMGQALYSRDPRSINVHLDVIAKVGAEKFMANYYVGYGHKSIGDCGTTTIYIEQVSMLAAKAIQDWPLYNGQEASTRYLDMSAQEVLNPLGSPEGKLIQNTWMDIYREVLAGLIPFLTEQFPRSAEQDEKTYAKAIKAKAFEPSSGV